MVFWGDLKPGHARARVPARCIDVELAEPLGDVVEPGYGSAYLLVRLRGQPVGVVLVPLTEGRCNAREIASAITDRLAAPLVRVALRQAMEHAIDASPIDAERLAQPPAADDSALPSVTVAVCTRGGSDTLPACLDAVRQLDHPDVEVIVVDNSAERDGLEHVVGPRRGVRFLHEPGVGLDRARNRAIVAATRDIVAFTDDDVLVDAGWARAIARLFASSPEVRAITGLVTPLELETHPQMMFEYYLGFGRGFERKWIEDASPNPGSIAFRHGNTGRLGTGANMAFRRSVLATIGGFDPALDVGTLTNGGGDLDMFFRVIKAGGMLVYEPAAVVRHRHRREWRELEEQLGDWGTGMRSYMERNRLNYPEERVPFAALLSWLLGTWHLRRLAWSVVDADLSTRLVVEEIRGLVRGGERYGLAQQVANDVARRVGATSPQPRAATRSRRRDHRRTHEIVDHVVDLAEPMESFRPGDHVTDVRLHILHGGRVLARTTFGNREHTVSAARLRDVAVQAAGPAIAGLPIGVRQRAASERECAMRVLAALQARATGTRTSQPTPNAATPEPEGVWRSRAGA